MANYKSANSEESSQEENIESNKAEKKSKKGCLLGCIGSTAFLSILSALIIPQFATVKFKAPIIALQYTMVNIMKTCLVRKSEGLSTEFSEIQYLADEHNNNRHSRLYKIEPYGDGNSCFNLVGKTEREWGYWRVLDDKQPRIGQKVKELVINPGASLSNQKHEHRSEHWYVLEGTVQIDCNRLFIGTGTPDEKEPLVSGTQLKELLDQLLLRYL